ncbi:MAG: caspase family protein [Candidatus Zixiibacteriota bacterium]
MQRVLFVLFATLLLVLTFGCSESPRITDSNSEIQIPTYNGKPATLVQRPEFVDNRPETVILSSILMPQIGVDKKPPQPPPDTGGTGEDPNPNPAHKYAYVVGISNYEGTANDLQYCDDDAREMKAYFQSQGFTVQSDLDLSATADNIIAGLNWLASVAQPGDEIAFSYSGHGAKYSNYGSCLISTDLYYITHSLVMDIFNSANCSKKLVAIDACEIGSFLSDGQTGSLVATASNTTYSYDAPDLNNGAWTYYFLEGTESLTFGEDIASYAEAGMKAWARIYHLRVSPSHTDKYTGMFDI